MNKQVIAAVPLPIRCETQHARRMHALATSTEDLMRLANEPSVEDVVVNPDGSLWVNRTGQGFQLVTHMAPERIRSILLQVAYTQGFEFNAQNPFLETDIPGSGARITGLCHPVVRGVALAIRPHPKAQYTMDDYRAAGIITHKGDPVNAKSHRDRFLGQVHGKDHCDILTLAIQHRQNIVVGGGTGSGKTTFLNMLFSEIGAICPDDRIVGIEDTLELQWGGIRNHVTLLASGDISAARCLETTMRLKPHRIVVGEVRKPKSAKALLEAWNTGHSGGVATVHADHAESTLRRIERLTRDMNPVDIARAINVVVFIDEDNRVPAGRKLREILVVHGYNRRNKTYETEAV